MTYYSSNTQDIQAIIRATIKLVITFTILYLIRTILHALPGIDVLIPNTPFTLTMIGNTVLGVLMMAVVLRFGSEVIPPMKNTVFPEPFINIILNLDYLVAIGLVYISFLPIVNAIKPNYVWGYSLTLFLLALYPIGNISLSFYKSIDKLTYLISERLVRSGSGNEEDTITCPSCSFEIDSNSVFCYNCGNKIINKKTDY